MKAEYANVFITSAVTVFQKELGIKMTRESLVRKEAPLPGLPVSIVIGITGSVRGQVVYSLDQSFAQDIAHVMMPNKLPSELRKLVNSAVGEIANMVTGQASIKLAGQDNIIHITPPAVFTGSDLQVDFLEVPTICLRLLSEMGVLEINIGILGSQEEQ
ncbi:chemotaxis protein CheX [Alkalispirochaeta americana]|uniref:Chemotaxis protein CheX n=1 Tax=Alkalispirochaeta americana TaxID=159291 RepID=A0A1N6Q6Y3_9SPIO|nr:chemotaxis protein CheX [Alkalispirochaeta americana]SIQ12368.1 chemotaxis protein CheX [Alkalispirochaeta americana]